VASKVLLELLDEFSMNVF